MKIGIFGGAFNPVHNGHIKLAVKYTELLNLDKLIVVPTANPPHKSNTDFASKTDRINMLNFAFENVKKVEVSDIEFKLKGKSYTYNTVSEIKQQFNNPEIYLIVGEDQFLSFNTWYRYNDILNSVTLCTAKRNENKCAQLREYAENILKCQNYIVVNYDPVVVSSSEIRAKIKNNEKVNDLIPSKVLNYIVENGLYTE